jgi:hypothetical protein
VWKLSLVEEEFGKEEEDTIGETGGGQGSTEQKGYPSEENKWKSTKPRK